MMENNSSKVFVVQVDHNKDLSDAKKYGQLQAIFGNPRKPYDTITMVYKAREILEQWQDGDHLLMLGDPILCGVCMAVASEFTDSVNILSWDRNSFSYIPQQWEFGQGSQHIHTAD